MLQKNLTTNIKITSNLKVLADKPKKYINFFPYIPLNLVKITAHIEQILNYILNLSLQRIS